ADLVRGDAAGAIAGGRVLHRADHGEMLGQAEVVVAAEVEQAAAAAMAVGHLAADTVAAQHLAAHAARRSGAALLARCRHAGVQIRAFGRHHGVPCQTRPPAARYPGAGATMPASHPAEMSACTVPPWSWPGASTWTCIARRPRRWNRAWSWATSGLPVVNSFSPWKIELAPAAKQSACSSSDICSRPADSRTMEA